MRNLDNFRQAVESPKSWNSIGYICPKNTFPLNTFKLKKTYAEDLSNISLYYLRENSPKSLCPFWNHKSPFTTQLVWTKTILSQTLHTFDKNISSKCKFSDFSLLQLKLIKFLMSFFKQKVSFFTKFGSFSSIMRDHSSALFFAETLNTIEKSSTSKCKFSDLILLALKFTKFTSCHFWNQEPVFPQTLHHSPVLREITLLYCFI